MTPPYTLQSNIVPFVNILPGKETTFFRNNTFCCLPEAASFFPVSDFLFFFFKYVSLIFLIFRECMISPLYEYQKMLYNTDYIKEVYL